MTPDTIIGIIFFVGMMVMIFCGIPVFISMLVASFGGFIALSFGGLNMTLTQFTDAIFYLGANYNYAVLPLFMLVGALAGATGIAEGAFKAMHKWFGRVKGGLLYTVIASNAVFGACSGSSVAGNIVFGKLAIPELKKAKYDESYSMGCITAAGALSTLIPPSMGILMFCMVAPSPIVFHGQNVTLSVGTALVSGIIPGIATAIALGITVRILGVTKKGSIPEPSGEKIPFVEKLSSLKLIVPILLLFGLIIGGTVLGWFTATVGGAIGAVAICIYALIKKIPLKHILHCIWDAAMMEGGIFPIIVGGQLFSRFVALSGLADFLSNAIISLNAPVFLVFLLVMLLYIVCGCVMDIVSVIIITVPVVFPILCSLGYSPYAVIVALCFMTEIAGLTPPIGMNVFATANALRVNPTEIFKGVVPYFICELLMVVLIALFPSMVTFLPGLIGKI
ncbi:MAG: TRAP transporter large permease subunit [Spirochaetales bacterium]|nr:TRAP transporter large permease subunit [Spirochaetales bacterium]